MSITVQEKDNNQRALAAPSCVHTNKCQSAFLITNNTRTELFHMKQERLQMYGVQVMASVQDFFCSRVLIGYSCLDFLMCKNFVVIVSNF